VGDVQVVGCCFYGATGWSERGGRRIWSPRLAGTPVAPYVATGAATGYPRRVLVV